MTTINHVFQPKQTSFSAPELQTLSMPELYDTEFPVPQPIIQDLLYPGLYILAGAPKIGKSFLMAQLAYHVARGEQLWNSPVQQSGVLYLALEDKFYRLQQRLVRMFDMEVADNLHMAVSAQDAGTGCCQPLSAASGRGFGSNQRLCAEMQRPLAWHSAGTAGRYALQ